MYKCIDIDLYKNGYDYNTINCLDMPIAGSAGSFYYDNYFYYCFYNTIILNWVDPGNTNLLDFRNRILEKMGLCLDLTSITDQDQLITEIKAHLEQNQPVILIIKYNSLFYNLNYKDDTYTLIHALVVHEYNTEKQTFGIKDSTFLQDVLKPEIPAYILFTLKITDEMLKTIWKLSNAAFQREQSIFRNRICYMHYIKKPLIRNYQDLIIDFAENYDLIKTNNFVKYIQKYNQNFMAETNIDMESRRRDFSGSLAALFFCMDQAVRTLKNEQWIKLYESTRDKYVAQRAKIMDLLQANIYRKKSIPGQEIDSLVKTVETNDLELAEFIKLLCSEIKKHTVKEAMNFVFPDIKAFFNNEGFSTIFSPACSADLSGTGVFFLTAGLPADDYWEIEDLKFHFNPKRNDGAFDNISCSAQNIPVPPGVYRSIAILACSEFGSYKEKLSINFKSGGQEAAVFAVSDFYQLPVYNEKTAWTGKAAEKRGKEVIQLNFNSRIFIYRIPVKNSTAEMTSISLPDRRNIHIFAITLI